MTKQPVQPARYFPKAYEEDPVSEEEDSEEEDEEKEQEAAARAPAPKATSFPRKLAVGEVKPAPKAPESTTQDDLAGFETASESSEGEGEDSGSEEEEGDNSEEDSSDDELRKPMLRPTFLSKAKRTQQQTPALSDEQRAQEEERKRKEKADELLQAQIERDTAARKAGKKSWDDDDAPAEAVDDTDGLDPEAERAAWK
jgi:microfibrillar-associated protein 1